MSNYDVLVQPDGRYWYVQVPAIERSTQAKGLDDIEPMAKDLITVMNDDDNPELKVTFVLPKQAKQHVTEMFRQREIAKKANAQAAAESRLAARALRNEGLTYRQIGALLGVSYQRAFQLVNGKTKHKTTASESPQPTTATHAPCHTAIDSGLGLANRSTKPRLFPPPKLKSTEQDLLIPAD